MGTETEPQQTARFGRSSRKRKRRTEKKKQQLLATQLIAREQSELKHTLDNIQYTTNSRTLKKYGFLPQENLSVHLNARRALGSLHPSNYFEPISKLAFHNLTENNELPNDTNRLLGLGLKFIPTPTINITQENLDHTFARFDRDIGLRVLFSGEDDNDTYDPSELRGTSNWRAPIPPPEIDNRILRFQQELQKLFIRRRTIPNLTVAQQQSLRNLRNNNNIVILSADKGLGPVGVTRDQYTTWGMKHLTDTSTYSLLTDEQAHLSANDLYTRIFQWTMKYRRELGDNTTKYIREKIESARNDPFGYFYLLAKLHKNPVSTRPVCSDCASLPHSVGKWVDRQLQPIVRRQHTYFKNSFELKELLDSMETLPANACLFTYDAISMYTNINTEQCLQRLTNFITDTTTLERFPHLKPRALIEALDIVLHNNRMRFDGLLIHQHKGIAMGMAPAPSIANLFVAIYEAIHIISFPTSSLPFIRRFIDDGFGIWLRNNNTTQDTILWESFQQLVNSMGLTWEFSPRSNSVVFMDLNITLHEGRLLTSLYSKPMALHLYIPPSSCHTPGLTTGLIHGHFYRMFMLCSNESDIEREIYHFFNRLLDRGYSLLQLIPIFLTAEQKARTHRAKQHLLLLQQHLPTHLCQNASSVNRTRSVVTSNDDNGVFFHLQYHPSNPSASVIQQLWRTHVFTPPGATPLYLLKNREGHPVNIKKLTIAYSRAPNLGNLLSCRRLRRADTNNMPPSRASSTHDESHGDRDTRIP